MAELLVFTLTAIPLVGGAIVGCRVVDGSVLRSLAVNASALSVAAAVAWFGLQSGWLWPLGLVTPVAAGLFVALAVRHVFSYCWRYLPAVARLEHPPMIARGGIGFAAGLVFAVGGWQAVLICGKLAEHQAAPFGSGPCARHARVGGTACMGGACRNRSRRISQACASCWPTD